MQEFEAALKADVQVTDGPHWRNDIIGPGLSGKGRAVVGVRWQIHISGKFQRTGLNLNIVTETKIERFYLGPTLNQGDDHQAYPNAEKVFGERNGNFYSHYIRRPIGIYDCRLFLAEPTPIDFSWKYEGDPESEPVRWEP